MQIHFAVVAAAFMDESPTPHLLASFTNLL
jgi:hypothetical protein